MCIAVPGQLIEREGSRGRVNIRGNLLSVEMGIVQADIGEYVLVHAGCAIAVVKESEAREISELLDLVEESGR